jgi:hypothetical protein
MEVLDLFNKKFMMLTIVLVGLLAISAVSAEDNATDEIAAISDDAVVEVDGDLTSQGDVSNTTTRTFTELNDAINANQDNDIYLDENYAYADSDFEFMDGIAIDRDVTIHGNGYTIDAKQGARIFNVSNNNVVFENIVFVNGYAAAHNSSAFDENSTVENGTDAEDNSTAGCGGAINGEYATAIGCIFINNHADHFGGAIMLGSAINCTFIDNSALYDGGALAGGTAENCIFISNHGDSGGAICYGGAFDCIFENNTADYDAGAILYGYAERCIFTGNSAFGCGGAIAGTDAKDCVFISNYAEDSGGAMGGNDAINCIFMNNSADYNGGATYLVDAINCSFENNYAVRHGGAMYFGYAENCTFKGNVAGIEGNSTYYTTLPEAILTVSNSTTTYNPGDKFMFNLTLVDGDPIDDAYVTIRIYDDDAFIASYYCLSGDGWIIDLGFGEYVAVLSVEDQCYAVDPVNTSFKIGKVATKIVSQDTVVTYNGGELVATLTTAATGKTIGGANVAVTLDGVDYALKTNSKGQVKVSTADLALGNYVAYISYKGNSKYKPSNATVNVNVVAAKRDTSISIAYNSESKEVVATLTNDEGKALTSANVVASLGGEDYSLKTNSKGQAKLSTEDLASGYYNVTVSYKGNSKYNPSTETAEIFVKKVAVLSAPDVTVAYGSESGEFIATLTNDEGKALNGANVVVTLGGVEYSLRTNSKGQVKVSTANLTQGSYVASVSYKGNTKYNPASTTATVVVNKKDSIISVIYDTETDELVATLTNNEGKALTSANVKVNINDAEYTLKTNSKGQAIFSMADLPLGKYTITVSYKGNAKYNPSYATIDIDIKTDVIISDIYDDSNELTATLTNADTGKAVSGANVKVNINGVTTTVKTNSKGKIKVSTADLNVTSYTASISYAGNSKYNPASATAKIDLNKTNVVLFADFDADNLELTAVLINSDTGKAVHGANVAVTLNGVSTTIKSDSKGQVIMPIDDLDSGTYVAVISYKGNSKYNPISTTVNVVIQ